MQMIQENVSNKKTMYIRAKKENWYLVEVSESHLDFFFPHLILKFS
jgi:hypothetical protein